MKLKSTLPSAVLLPALAGGFLALADAQPVPSVQETEKELITSGDFNGDGRRDVVIVDRASGKYRLGFQSETGGLAWVPHRLSGIKDVSWISVGKLLDAKKDAIVIASKDAGALVLLDGNPAAPVDPKPVEFSALGPNTVTAIDVGGAGNTPFDDLYVATEYNDPNQIYLLRNAAGTPAAFAESEIKEPVAKATRAALKAGGKDLVLVTVPGKEGDGFRIEDVGSGQPKVVATATGLPVGSDFLVGEFRTGGARDVVFFKRGESKIIVKPATEQAGGYQLGAGATYDLGQPLKTLTTVPAGGKVSLLAIFGKGESATVFSFDGASAPAPIQVIAAKQGELLFGAAASEKGFVLLNAPDYSRFSTAYTLYSFAGTTNAVGPHGSLATMADSDDTTLPDIQRRAAASVQGITAESMKPFTNVIPGTKVAYTLVPIPGGEFTIGSPDTEPSRNADEGPRRKIKIAPFWMGTMEVRWEEYEIFMYPDDEKKLREVNPSDPEVSKVSDAVTRPSKPYMEMSFGMGKDGYPAISMTQHAANKYCQWLSAKTGQFYRLPTEAEWEYACRAGTTTAYSFGDDPEALKDYAWFEDNSDFKYQKIGKKKPNPWGLYDIHGNVAEWCLDQYAPNYDFLKEGVNENPWNKATKAYPHVARGGSWDEPAAKLRSAVRRGSDPTWKMRDPQLPKSIWWLTDAQFVGFRLVRPLAVPSVEEMKKYWNSGVERE